jgi:hypothetical protein
MKSDIEYLQTVIIPNTEGSMVISIKIVALVPGSSIAGATTDPDNLV